MERFERLRWINERMPIGANGRELLRESRLHPMTFLTKGNTVSFSHTHTPTNREGWLDFGESRFNIPYNIESYQGVAQLRPIEGIRSDFWVQFSQQFPEEYYALQEKPQDSIVFFNISPPDLSQSTKPKLYIPAVCEADPSLIARGGRSDDEYTTRGCGQVLYYWNKSEKRLRLLGSRTIKPGNLNLLSIQPFIKGKNRFIIPGIDQDGSMIPMECAEIPTSIPELVFILNLIYPYSKKFPQESNGKIQYGCYPDYLGVLYEYLSLQEIDEELSTYRNRNLLHALDILAKDPSLVANLLGNPDPIRYYITRDMKITPVFEAIPLSVDTLVPLLKELNLVDELLDVNPPPGYSPVVELYGERYAINIPRFRIIIAQLICLPSDQTNTLCMLNALNIDTNTNVPQ